MSESAHIVRLACLAAALCGTAMAAPDKPNILVILADDLGYADVGFQGCQDIPTPHLDRLARSGLRCTSGYVTHPFCSPTRAGLMTGRYQQRFGHEGNPFFDPADHTEGLPTAEKLLPEFLRPAGYVSGWIGKWHLGAAPEFRPERRGFAETFGFIGGGHHYLNWQVKPAVEYNVPVERDGRPVEVTEHLTVVFGREAAGFIRRHATGPWFLYLAFNAPHTPHEPTPERLAKFAGMADKRRAAYAAQVSLLDDAIGETLAALHDTKQEQRTLVFFLSDNGGPIGQRGNGSVNRPLRDGKGSVYEGGVRVPFVVSWPGTIPAGKDYAPSICSLDIFATALSLAGVPLPTNKTCDGGNVLPLLTGAISGMPETLYWRSGSQWALRDEGLKLVRHTGRQDELYDLAGDPGESTNLAALRSNDVKRLAERLDAWDKELIEPVFRGAAARRAAKPTPPAHPAKSD